MEQLTYGKQWRGCTTECGVPQLYVSDKMPLTWFPMRVTYNRELKVKAELDLLGIENFLPMRYELEEGQKGRQLKRVPAIHNLLFIHSDEDTLTTLKRTRRALAPLRYMTRPIERGERREERGKRAGESGREIIRVPDRQMENFMRVASLDDERVMFLDYNDFIASPGKRVKVTEGFFAGVEGTVKRIKNNRHVVVQIDGVAAVAIAYIPAKCLMGVDS